MYEDTSHNLSSPRFDEEATLLSARQVVPLSELSKQRSRRFRWQFVAVALVATIALMTIGLVLGQRGTAPTQAAAQTPQAEDLRTEQTAAKSETPAPAPAETTNEIEENQETIATAEPESNTAPQVKLQTSKEIKAVAENRKRTVTTRRRVVSTPDEDQRSTDEYDPVFEDWQARREMMRERRLERRARRDALMRRDQDPDGLFRVPDIFQGRRRRY